MDNDLISREALKKAYFNAINETSIGEVSIIDLIDNAPTVDIRNNGACENCVYFDRPTTLEPCKNCTLAYGSCFKEKEKVKDDRPQGEWITDYDHLKCPFCKMSILDEVHWLYSKEYNFNFCPNCGADMRGKDNDVP